MIVFDCTTASFWSGHPTGINRVVEQLGKELIRQEPSVALAVFDDEGQCREFSLETKELGRALKFVPAIWLYLPAQTGTTLIIMPGF